MPTRKEIVGTYRGGTVVEYEVSVYTEWVQIVAEGPVFLRCDNAAKETGVGTWYVDDSALHRFPAMASRTWQGSMTPRALKEFKTFSKDLWVADKKTFRYQYEKDYS